MHNEFEKYKGTETILLVEDEEIVRDSFREFLELFGYEVIVAVDGQNAVAQYIKNIDKIDLVFSDIIMPNKNGLSAYKDIKQLNPNVKYILTSGFVPTGQVIHDIPFLKKPSEPSDVIGKIRSILDT